MKINCLGCGHTVDLRDAYDDYDGQIRCFTCGALMALTTHEGQVKWVELASPSGARVQAEPTLQRSP